MERPSAPKVHLADISVIQVLGDRVLLEPIRGKNETTLDENGKPISPKIILLEETKKELSSSTLVKGVIISVGDGVTQKLKIGDIVFTFPNMAEADFMIDKSIYYVIKERNLIAVEKPTVNVLMGQA